jgi:dCMP deaminase
MDVKEISIKITKEPKYAKWLKNCYEYAKKSNHPGTHNAALLIKKNKIVLFGLNILPPGVKYKKERFESPNKHFYLNHAERDAIYKAARKGVSTDGMTMVMPWLPCIDCADAIITAGIKTLIVHKQMIERTESKWKGELLSAAQIMKEAKIKIIAYDGRIGAKAYMHSNEWEA